MSGQATDAAAAAAPAGGEESQKRQHDKRHHAGKKHQHKKKIPGDTSAEQGSSAEDTAGQVNDQDEQSEEEESDADNRLADSHLETHDPGVAASPAKRGEGATGGSADVDAEVAPHKRQHDKSHHSGKKHQHKKTAAVDTSLDTSAPLDDPIVSPTFGDRLKSFLFDAKSPGAGTAGAVRRQAALSASSPPPHASRAGSEEPSPLGGLLKAFTPTTRAALSSQRNRLLLDEAETDTQTSSRSPSTIQQVMRMHVVLLHSK